MRDVAWCAECYTDVSLSHAVAELPCPNCGGKGYSCFVGDLCRDNMLDEAERRMRIGRWDDARAIIRCCCELGSITAADRNLTIATVDWREKCAVVALGVLCGEGGVVPLAQLRGRLTQDFDDAAVSWLLKEFHGIGVDRANKICFVKGE